MQERPCWQSLTYRWFVQYNPLYLVSAALVLVGVFLVSDGLARSDGLGAELWLTAIVELYQLLLIGGAALLYRIGQRRPAVMLAMLQVVYICDLTFQTGVSAYLGTVGVVASVVWLGLFVIKLHALAWALRLRLSLSAAVLPIVGAAGLALLPHLLYHQVLGPGAAETLLGWWVFGLVAAGLWSERTISSIVELDRWGRTVLRRATRASWVIWLGLTLGHVLWWSADHDLWPILILLTATTLLSTRWIKTELGAWTAVLATLAATAYLDPTALSSAAMMAAVVLVLRGWRAPAVAIACTALTPVNAHPYRAAEDSAAQPPPSQRPPWNRPEAQRLYVGAAVLVYLSIWTLGWQGELWLDHRLWLDVPLTLLLLVVAWRFRMVFALLPLGAVYGHLVVQKGIGPKSSLQWGTLTLICGFGLLLLGLAVNWLARSTRR